MNNVWECLHYATLELVRSTPIKHRLVGAYRRHLIEIREDQLPRELRDTFIKIMKSLRGVRPLPGEDEVAASVRKMSNHEADECATAIVEMFGALSGSGNGSSANGTAGNGSAAARSAATIVNLHGEIPAIIASVSRA